MSLRAILAVVVFASACTGAPAASSLADAVKVCAAGATTQGIDVSHWDGTIDWDKVKADNFEYAFIKSTEGTTFVDPEFATYWPAAATAGIVRGAYHFFRPADDATAQAEFFVQTAGAPELGDFPLTLDLETTDGLTPAEVAAGALTFLQRVEALTGRTPIIYTSARVFDTVLGTPAGFSRYPLWDANYGVTCPTISQPTWPTWMFWQDTDAEVVSGIAAGVDRDYFNGSLDALMTYVNTPGAVNDAGVALDAGGLDLGANDLILAPPDLATSADLAVPITVERHPLIRGGCSISSSAAPPSAAASLVLIFALALQHRPPRKKRVAARSLPPEFRP